MRLTLRLAEEIPKIRGLNVTTKPTMNIVGLESDAFSVRRLAEELRLRKWAVALFPGHIRLVIMPHVKETHVERLLQDLDTISNKLRG
jgi:tyrosine decarboxylase/aspartate 1-decarboxylase